MLGGVQTQPPLRPASYAAIPAYAAYLVRDTLLIPITSIDGALYIVMSPSIYLSLQVVIFCVSFIMIALYLSGYS